MRIETRFSAAEAEPVCGAGAAVVIDVIRATTTIL